MIYESNITQRSFPGFFLLRIIIEPLNSRVYDGNKITIYDQCTNKKPWKL